MNHQRYRGSVEQLHTSSGMIRNEGLVGLSSLRQMTLVLLQSSCFAIHDTLGHRLDSLPTVRHFELRHIFASHHGLVYSRILISIRVTFQNEGMERISIAAEEMSVLVGVPRVEQDRLTRQTPVEVSAQGRYYRDSDIQRSSKDY